MRFKLGMLALAMAMVATSSAWAQTVSGSNSDGINAANTFVIRDGSGVINAAAFNVTGAGGGSITVPHINGLVDINSTSTTQSALTINTANATAANANGFNINLTPGMKATGGTTDGKVNITQGGLLITAGGETITAGGLTVTSGGIDATSGLVTTSGTIQTTGSGAITAAGVLTGHSLVVTTSGASITGGLNNNSGDITGVGANITGTAGITIGTTGDLTLSPTTQISLSSKPVIGATSITGSGSVTLAAGGTAPTNVVLKPTTGGFIDASTFVIKNVVDPSGAQDAATKKYVDNGDAATLASANATSAAGDVATLSSAKSYTDSRVSTVDGTTLSTNLGNPSQQFSLNLGNANSWNATQTFTNTTAGIITNKIYGQNDANVTIGTTTAATTGGSLTLQTAGGSQNIILNPTGSIDLSSKPVINAISITSNVANTLTLSTPNGANGTGTGNGSNAQDIVLAPGTGGAHGVGGGTNGTNGHVVVSSTLDVSTNLITNASTIQASGQDNLSLEVLDVTHPGTITLNAGTDGTTAGNIVFVGNVDLSNATTFGDINARTIVVTPTAAESTGVVIKQTSGNHSSADVFTVQDLSNTPVKFLNVAHDGSVNTSGNASVGGTLSVTSTSSLGGNTSITGTLGVSSDVNVNSGKFTVAATSGNTAIAGNLTVGGGTLGAVSQILTGTYVFNFGGGKTLLDPDNAFVDGTGAAAGDTVIVTPTDGTFGGTAATSSSVTVSAIQATTTVVTLTTMTQTFAVGQTVTVAGLTDGTTVGVDDHDSSFNGTYVITAATGTSVSFAKAGTAYASHPTAAGGMAAVVSGGGSGAVWIPYVSTAGRVNIRLLSTAGTTPTPATSVGFRVTIIKH